VSDPQGHRAINLPGERMTVHFDIQGDTGTVRHEYWDEATQRDRDWRRFMETGSTDPVPQPASEVLDLYRFLATPSEKKEVQP
jgi:hypothetical protein